MGRKRKNKASVNGAEDNAFLETTGEEKHDPQTNHGSNDVEAMNIEDTTPSNPNGSPQTKKIKKSKLTEVVATRRSSRIKKSSLVNGTHNAEHAAEHVIDLDEREEKEEASNHQQEITLPDSCEENLEEEQPQIELPNSVDKRNVEEKVDYIVQVVDDLVSKNFKQVTRRQNKGSSTEYSYKSLYIESQKKTEALMEQNYELIRKLEFANGKLDAYEKMHNAISAPKEVILVSRLEKDVEVKILSPQKAQEFISADVADVHNVSPKQKRKSYKMKKVTSG